MHRILAMAIAGYTAVYICDIYSMSLMSYIYVFNLHSIIQLLVDLLSEHPFLEAFMICVNIMQMIYNYYHSLTPTGMSRVNHSYTLQLTIYLAYLMFLM